MNTYAELSRWVANAHASANGRWAIDVYIDGTLYTVRTIIARNQLNTQFMVSALVKGERMPWRNLDLDQASRFAHYALLSRITN